MGKRGPARAPTALRLIKGDRKDRFNDAEPIARSGELIPPVDLAPEVRQVWDETVAELEAMHIDFPADRDPLVCYCEAVITHRKASAILAVSPVLIKGLHGGMVRNPAIQIQRDAAVLIRAFAQEFGLTPSARSSVRVPTSPDGHDNPFA